MFRFTNLEAERATRSVARFGSIVAGGLLGLACLTDLVRHAALNGEVVVFTAAIALMIVGYALAWMPAWETLGSVLALASLAVAFVATDGLLHLPEDLLLLGVGLPAVMHLLAVALHLRGTPAPVA